MQKSFYLCSNSAKEASVDSPAVVLNDVAQPLCWLPQRGSLGSHWKGVMELLEKYILKSWSGQTCFMALSISNKWGDLCLLSVELGVVSRF